MSAPANETTFRLTTGQLFGDRKSNHYRCFILGKVALDAPDLILGLNYIILQNQ
jgi:hypothetical protein